MLWNKMKEYMGWTEIQIKPSKESNQILQYYDCDNESWRNIERIEGLYNWARFNRVLHSSYWLEKISDVPKKFLQHH